MTTRRQHTKKVMAELSAIAERASKAGITLKFTQQGEEWHWQWSNGINGFTNASKPVALAFAMEDVAPWLS